MAIYYVKASTDGLLQIVDNISSPVYIVQADSEADAISLTNGYRYGHYWATELALNNFIRMSRG